jgi:signal transduction histidine kinase
MWKRRLSSIGSGPPPATGDADRQPFESGAGHAQRDAPGGRGPQCDGGGYPGGAPERRVECVIGYGDPRLLWVVLEDLLGNAWKFTINKPQARIELGISHQHGGSAYFVRDDGPGFDMAHVDKLFGTFQRLHTTTEFPGTGIGLASVRRIINRHGGRTWAEGAIGKGATFSFTLSEDQGGRPSA